MSDPQLQIGIGGGSPPLGGPPLGGPSLDDDEKAMKRGSGVVLIALGAFGALVIAGIIVAVLMSGGDDSYTQIGQQVNGMKRDHFDQFWGCALPNENLRELRTDGALRRAITERASSSPSRYAQHVRGQCLVKLNEHEAPLDTLIAPDDLREQITALGAALDLLREGWNEYLSALEQAEAFDEEAMAPHLEKIARGWYDYKRAHGAVNDVVREHLGQ
jgi:hypothetical protein